MRTKLQIGINIAVCLIIMVGLLHTQYGRALSNSQTDAVSKPQPQQNTVVVDMVTSPQVITPTAVSVVAPLDVVMHKSVSPEQVAANGVMAYTIAYTNSGEIVLSTAVITDVVPSHTTFLDAQEGGVYDSGEVRWILGDIPAGGTGTVHFRTQVDSGTLPGTTITNTAYFTSPQSLLWSSNPVTSTVRILPDFGFSTKTATGGSTVEPGDLVTYTIEYQNSGTETAVGVVISDTLSPYVTYRSGGQYSNGTVVFNISTVGIGESGSVFCVVQVKDDVVGGSVITNAAVIDSAQTTPMSTNVVAQTVNSAHLLLRKTVTPTGLVTPSTLLTYTLTYTNDGNLDATNVVISDVLPPGVLYFSGGDAWDGSTLTWDIGTLSPGGEGQVSFTVQVLEGVGQIDNVAYAKAPQTQLTPSNYVTTLVDAAALVVVKSATPVAEVFQGAVLTYTLSYTSTGTTAVHNALLVDPLDPDLTFVSGGTYISASHAVSFPLGTVLSGSSGEVSFAVQVNAAVGDNISNSTQLFYDEYYPYASAAPLDLSGALPYTPYGGSSGREYIAQSFVATVPRLLRAGIFVYGATLPYPTVEILISGDDNGKPDLTQNLASSTSFTLTESGQRYFVEPLSSLSLQLGARYWMIVHFTTGASGSAGVRYVQDLYLAGQWLYSDDAGANWNTPAGLANADLDMRVEYANPPLSNQIIHTVLESPRCLTVSPQTLRFYAVQDANPPAAKLINVANCALGKVDWSASESAAWLTITPTIGQAPSTIAVSVNQAGLALGEFNAPIIIDGGDAQNSPQTVQVTLSVITGKIYLPFVLRNWPPKPPTLSISTPNQNGDYTVSWTDTGADLYILQEASDNIFAGATEVYSGTATTFNVVDKGPTRYYYRIRSVHNDYTTNWSTTQLVDVVWEREPNNDLNSANGVIISSVTYHGYFEDIPDYFKINITQAGTVRMTLTGGSVDDSIALRNADGEIVNSTCYKWLSNSNPLICTVQSPGQYYFQVYAKVPRPVTYSFSVIYP